MSQRARRTIDLGKRLTGSATEPVVRGGASAPSEQPWGKGPANTEDARIDIEIVRGSVNLVPPE